MEKINEILSELKKVLAGKNKLFLDTLIPPVLFVIIYNIRGVNTAVTISIGFALTITIYRFFEKSSPYFALGGLAGIFITTLFIWISNTPSGFFLPNIMLGFISAGACIISIFLGKPLAAYTSKITRGWPIDWYWHKRVKPAYQEVTFFWALYFFLKSLIQLYIYFSSNVNIVALSDVVFGLPATIVLLIISYLYGTWKLKKLKGPSIKEFIKNKKPPWHGQEQGF